MSDDLHPETFAESSDVSADLAESDDPEGLPAELRSQCVAPSGVIAQPPTSRKVEQEEQGMFGDRPAPVAGPVTSAYTDSSNTYDPGGRLGQIMFRINW